MKVFLENFNSDSDSGPNGFTKKLFSHLIKSGDVSLTSYEQADLSFCLIQEQLNKIKSRVLRLDGIYFNIDQDYTSLNHPIKATYDASDAVIFQTEFNQRLIETWFGKHDNGHIIRNGTDHDLIKTIPQIRHEILDQFREIWTCAAACRPHKRLDENIRYFLEFAPDDAALVVMGKDAEQWLIHHPRVLYVSHVPWEVQISVCKRASTFLHLAWLDHCPNVVVDALAAGCKIICSTAGGTREIAGQDATLIIEDDWDFNPVKLYHPPKLDFSKIDAGTTHIDSSIASVARSYMSVLEGVITK